MFSKKCPKCNSDIEYKSKDALNRSVKLNSKCKGCGRKSSGDKQRKINHCKICNVELPYGKTGTCSDAHRVELIKKTKFEKYGSSTYNNRDKALKTTVGKYGVENVAQLDEIKQKVTSKGRHFSRINTMGEGNPMFGKTHTDESILKMRISRIEELKGKFGQTSPNYNPSSIPIIEAKAKELGITDLQHAENGGEFSVLGYFVDGYSAEKNIVIEYDESYHKRQVEKDNKRQIEIEKYLNCTFIRLAENKSK